MSRIKRTRQKQRGAVIITVCLMLLFLLGFMAFALDLSRLYIVKDELQTAMDSCALAAANELDSTSTALVRARSAGTTAGNMNRVNMQDSAWDTKGQITDATFTFRDAGFNITTIPANARYAECVHTQPGVRLWLLQALGAFSSDHTLYPSSMNVAARAVATRGSAQTTCPIPVVLRPKTPGAPAPNFGYSRGEWVTLLNAAGAGTNGYMGWANLDGTNSASETERELGGSACDTVVGDSLGTPGVQASIADIWNTRFGIYKNTYSPTTQRPDYTGYAYTTNNWPSGASAYDGPTPARADPTAANFTTKRAQFATCADTTTDRNTCRSIINRTIQSGNSWSMIPPGVGASNGHWQYGMSRRVVLVPVTNTYPGRVEDYACMLMLQPLNIPMTDIQLEFIGQASAPGSPCAPFGLPGGVGGPLVPLLVR